MVIDHYQNAQSTDSIQKWTKSFFSFDSTKDTYLSTLLKSEEKLKHCINNRWSLMSTAIIVGQPLNNNQQNQIAYRGKHKYKFRQRVKVKTFDLPSLDLIYYFEHSTKNHMNKGNYHAKLHFQRVLKINAILCDPPFSLYNS